MLRQAQHERGNFTYQNQCGHVLGRVCLQAHLDHPGGILCADRQIHYLFTKYYGINAKLVGYQLGVYEPGVREEINRLEIETAVFQKKDKATCLFFKNNQKLYEELSEKTFILHYDALLNIEETTISNWNLDDLINCAFIISLLKKKAFSGSLYGLLSINEETFQEGIRGFLSNLVGKPLFFVNLDIIDNTSQLKNLDDEPYQQQYGIRAEQSGIKLDQFLFPKLIKDGGSDYLAKIPVGQCEADVMQKTKQPFISVFLKIDHYHNGVKQRKFMAEQLSTEVFSRYVNFVESTVERVRGYIPTNPNLWPTAIQMPEIAGTIKTFFIAVERFRNTFIVAYRNYRRYIADIIFP